MDRPVDFTSVLGLVYKDVGVALGCHIAPLWGCVEFVRLFTSQLNTYGCRGGPMWPPRYMATTQGRPYKGDKLKVLGYFSLQPKYLSSYEKSKQCGSHLHISFDILLSLLIFETFHPAW